MNRPEWHGMYNNSLCPTQTELIADAKRAKDFGYIINGVPYDKCLRPNGAVFALYKLKEHTLAQLDKAAAMLQNRHDAVKVIWFHVSKHPTT